MFWQKKMISGKLFAHLIREILTAPCAFINLQPYMTWPRKHTKMAGEKKAPTSGRDPYLLSRTGCIHWTAIGVALLLFNLDCQLHLWHSGLDSEASFGIAKLSGAEFLILALLILIFMHALFLHLARLHLKARICAGLKAGHAPLFAVDWQHSRAKHVALILLVVTMLFPFLTEGYLIHNIRHLGVFVQKQYQGSVAALSFSVSFLRNNWHEDIFIKPLQTPPIASSSNSVINGEIAGIRTTSATPVKPAESPNISFYPVIVPSFCVLALGHNLFMMLSLTLHNRCRFAPLEEYPKDES